MSFNPHSMIFKSFDNSEMTNNYGEPLKIDGNRGSMQAIEETKEVISLTNIMNENAKK